MGYNRNKYARFQSKERVFVKSLNKVETVEASHCDIINDMWSYRLVGIQGWFLDTDLEKISMEESKNNAVTASAEC